jgi:hypothetical protein
MTYCFGVIGRRARRDSNPNLLIVVRNQAATDSNMIQKHGLLSTARLLDLFGVDPAERNEILTRTRREPTRLEAPGFPPR